MTEKYNGWANRETWLVNLHYGDDFSEYIREELEENRNEYDAYEVGEKFKEFVFAIIDEELEKLSLFLRDMMDLEAIDWEELGETVLNE